MIRLVSLLVLMVLSSTAHSNAALTSGCTAADEWIAGCATGTINGGGVTLSGSKNGPGSSGKSNGAGKGSAGSNGSNGSNGSSGSSGSKGSTVAKPPAPVCTKVAEACQTFSVTPPGAPGNPAITINELKNFPASPGTDHMEPNGWMVVGLDTNFYSEVGVEIVNGQLLGQAARVRFTPILWHWTYGDGSTATLATAGRTWAAQGIPEFDPTSTSHVYRADGTYFIDLSITFRAEYAFATSTWTPVVGTITLPANRLEATAGDAKTVLVNRDCTQNPTGPGC